MSLLLCGLLLHVYLDLNRSWELQEKTAFGTAAGVPEVKWGQWHLVLRVLVSRRGNPSLRLAHGKRPNAWRLALHLPLPLPLLQWLVRPCAGAVGMVQNRNRLASPSLAGTQCKSTSTHGAPRPSRSAALPCCPVRCVKCTALPRGDAEKCGRSSAGCMGFLFAQQLRLLRGGQYRGGR